MRKLSDRYLEQCKMRAFAVDPLGADIVLRDLRKRVNVLVKQVKLLQSIEPINVDGHLRGVIKINGHRFIADFEISEVCYRAITKGKRRRLHVSKNSIWEQANRIKMNYTMVRDNNKNAMIIH